MKCLPGSGGGREGQGEILTFLAIVLHYLPFATVDASKTFARVYKMSKDFVCRFAHFSKMKTSSLNFLMKVKKQYQRCMLVSLTITITDIAQC